VRHYRDRPPERKRAPLQPPRQADEESAALSTKLADPILNADGVVMKSLTRDDLALLLS
jgi:hypothetical protein